MTDIIYIDAPAYNRKVYGTAAAILEQLELNGPWLKSRFLARELGISIELANRTLHRLYHRGQVQKRTIDEQRPTGGNNINEWALA